MFGRNKMEVFIGSTDPLMVEVVQNEINPTIGTISNSSITELKDGNANTSPIPSIIITPQELAKWDILYAKTLYSLYCVLSHAEYNFFYVKKLKKYGIDSVWHLKIDKSQRNQDKYSLGQIWIP